MWIQNRMSQSANCPICSEQCIIDDSNIHNLSIECIRCGNFNLTDTAKHSFTESDFPNKVVYLSYWIRKNQSTSNALFIDLVTLKKILSSVSLPKPKEQADNLLIWVASNVDKYDSFTNIQYSHLVSVVGCYDISGLKYIEKHLFAEGYIEAAWVSSTIDSNAVFNVRMTFKGWNKYDELLKTSKESRLVFMAMKFSNTVLDKIFNDVIKDAVTKTGFEIRKLDEEKRAGLIDDKLRVEIRRSKFLIADLSDDNNGAYWEAGYAEGLGMPVVYICEKEKFEARASHFDTNHHLTVQWKDDPDSLKSFAEELKATIRATFPAEAKMED
jgi:Zn ribbon nucleic-acid-binding protein